LGGVAVALIALTLLTERKTDAVAASPAIRVSARAAQWTWSFTVTREGQSRSSRTLVIPSGTTVRVDLRSADVIHSMWIPEARFKRYAFPDRTTSFDLRIDTPGTYGGLCSQFCGLRHEDMRFSVRVIPAGSFDSWIGSGS